MTNCGYPCKHIIGSCFTRIFEYFQQKGTMLLANQELSFANVKSSKSISDALIEIHTMLSYQLQALMNQNINDEYQ